MDLARVTSSVRMDDTVRVKDPRRRRWSEHAGVVGLSGPRSCDVQCEVDAACAATDNISCQREKRLSTEFVTLPDNARNV